ncbi:unnamed protein product [Schistosoma turkestanicum]|nr:unnamed protein product [Schistosoma turkestanicum]
MIKWAFSSMSEASKKSICDRTTWCTFNSTGWTEPRLASAFILLSIALILTQIIIFIKALHTASTRNNVFMIITLIIMIVGVALLTLCGAWYEQVIAAMMSFSVMIFAIELVLGMKGSTGRWRMLLFSLWCVFITLGLVCSILSIIEMSQCKIAFPVLSAICWLTAMLIVIALTTYYLVKYQELEEYSIFYIRFIISFEFLILLIISQLHVNFIFHCCHYTVLSS